ncbi:MAG: protein translocase subunit SecDF [Flavobacteriales bacterium]|nr:protein translocase subunit SecDF [Flavobacteriales bacterium]
MRNKGFTKFLAVVFALICIYQLAFTWMVKSVESDAKTYANGDYKLEKAYLDSVATDELYFGYSYKECKEQEMNLGLDLKGGMNVTLEVSVGDILRILANNSKDATFNEAIYRANAKQSDSQNDYIDDFVSSFDEVNEANETNVLLSSPRIFGHRNMLNKFEVNAADDEVIAVVREELKGAIDRAFSVLRARIDKFGVVQPNIQQLEQEGRILVELPGVKDHDRVKRLLQSTAQLEFWETTDIQQLQGFVSNVATVVKAEQDQISAEEESFFSGDSLQLDSLDQSVNPFFELLNVQYAFGARIGVVSIEDTAKVNEIMKRSDIRSLLSGDLRNTKFLWSAKPLVESGEEIGLELVAIKSNRDDQAQLSGDVIVDANSQIDPTGLVNVSMRMNAEGAKKWKKLTENNIGRQVAIVLDGYVYSFPTVNDVIPNGSSSISGNFTVEEAEDLSNILKAGKLPAPAKIIQSEIVGPSLGAEAISAGLKSFAIALLIVLVYMIFYYQTAGLAANFALVLNILFIFGVLASLGAVLSLPGIAGIVLTIGMAVDANVLIYERIREELRMGKGLSLSISDGYKNAYAAIIDANVTTLLTGIILYTFGTGPIKGFATTLIIGIITSLFAAIFLTRLVFEAKMESKKPINFASSLTKGWFANTSISFLAKRKRAYLVSALLVALGVSSLATRGLNQGVDFKGGRTYVVRFDQNVVTQEVRSSLATPFETAPEVKTFGKGNQVKITTKYLIDEKGTDELVDSKLNEGLATLDMNYEVMSSQLVGPTIADDIKQSAVWAVLFSLVVIFMYILIRFRKMSYSVGAVAAVFHDVLIVLSVFSLLYGKLPFSLEIDQAFIAAILTVIGYSLNDTVVVFDRIREYFGSKSGSREEVVNAALNSTLSRTINTSLTTFFVLLVIFLFGGEVIRGFMFALMIGVAVGTYSSLFIATPIMVDTLKKDSEE